MNKMCRCASKGHARDICPHLL